MANGKTTHPPQNAALTATREDEKLALAFQRLVQQDKKITRDLKTIKWMLIVGVTLLTILFIYYLYSAFGLLGYW